MAKKQIPNISNKNKIIEREKLKRLEKKVTDVLPNIYACFAITLMQEKYGFDKQDIADLFEETGAIWKACSEKKISMREWAKDLCDIDVISLATSKISNNVRAEEVEVWDCGGATE